MDLRMDPDGSSVATPSRLRRLLTLRWIGFTLLVIAAVATFLFLAWWQLRRYESWSGDWQNLGYALQWPFFAVFAVYLWWRLLRDGDPSAQPEHVEGVAANERPLARTGAGAGAGAARAGSGTERRRGAGSEAEPVALPPLPPKRLTASAVAAPATNGAELDEADAAALAAYNRYLTALSERDRDST
jgi:DNA-binding transcriptional regulator of glucitol operon